MAFNISSIDLKDKKTQIMILAELLAVLAVIIYLSFILVPQIERVFEAVSQVSKIGADLKVAEDNIANIPRFKSNLATYEEKVDRYEKMLPAQQEIPTLLESLSDMAKSSNVKIVGIMPVVGKEGKVKKSQIY
ncbi:MAG: type 4a pilus biogenesis protein PilO, partial [Candidatus Omnitrophica bacterium]|nr:type 4a pilus biogenesis protein PilO [Candidatus Omnitrophota bacterium]